MMRGCAIYSGGPSLAETLVPGTSAKYDCVIGVTHGAAFAHHMGERVDWFVCGEAAAFKRYGYEVSPTTGLLCTPSSKRYYLEEEHAVSDELEVLLIQDLPNRDQHKRVIFSLCAALLLAESLGYNHADCYGVDHKGERYCTNHEPILYQTRWEKEKEVLADIEHRQLMNGFTHLLINPKGNT